MLLDGELDFPDDGFTHLSGRYMCQRGCCKPVHCTKALWRVAIVELVTYGASQIAYFFFLERTITGTLMSQLEIITAICLFLGLHFQNYRPIVVAVIIWMLTILTFFLLITLFIYCMHDTRSIVAEILFKEQVPHGFSGLFLTDHTALRIGFALLVLAYLVPMALGIWFCNIGGRCYQYFRDHEIYRRIYGDKEDVHLRAGRP